MAKLWGFAILIAVAFGAYSGFRGYANPFSVHFHDGLYTAAYGLGTAIGVIFVMTPFLIVATLIWNARRTGRPVDPVATRAKNLADLFD